MVNTGYISDVIQVQSHTVWNGYTHGGRGYVDCYQHKVYQTYSDYG